MADRALVFAMRTPTPEGVPEEIAAEVIATGRSDYPNQINNVLAFPRGCSGAVDVKAREITTDIESAAAHAVAAIVKPEETHSSDPTMSRSGALTCAVLLRKSVSDERRCAPDRIGQICLGECVRNPLPRRCRPRAQGDRRHALGTRDLSI
jgi:malate dehydrogenase (oxaloacetate-decarboxylating)